MAILIDPPRWPAHGIRWSHLVSDTSLEELHEFARALGLPRRSFDLDHYDVAEFDHPRAADAGALQVTGHDLVRALHASGLRVRQADRERMKRVRRREFLNVEWQRLGHQLAVDAKRWEPLGVDIIHRWNEPHRSYHDQRHLEDVLLALDHLEKLGERISPATLLAAWFHDAVYEGQGGDDERASADLAVTYLRPTGLSSDIVEEVGEFIVATTPGADLADVPLPLAALLDADLAIFGAGAKRYAEYGRAVRAEYSFVDEDTFRAGRAQVLRSYLSRARIYRLDASASLWEARARQNLEAEIEQLLAE